MFGGVFAQDELIEMCVDLEAKLLFRSKCLSEYWRNANTATKYPKLSAEVEPFSLAFPRSHMVKASFSHLNAVLTKQRNRPNMEERGDLRPKLTSLQPMSVLLLVTIKCTFPFNDVNCFSQNGNYSQRVCHISHVIDMLVIFSYYY